MFQVRKIVQLQSSNWDSFHNSLDDDAGPFTGSPQSNESSNFLGGFLEDVNYAWLSCGPKLVVVNVKTGVNICTWTFKERVSCVSPFPAQPGQIPLLLVGLDNDATRIKESYGLVCIFNCTISQVLRAIRVPAGVEQLCVVNGGAEWEDINDKRVDNLMEHQGLACVALRNLDHFMVDLRRNSWENPTTLPIADETNPAEIDIAESNTQSARHRTHRERHAVHNLVNERLERYIGFNREKFGSSTLYQEMLTTAMVCSRKIGCLISGCLGRIIIWQNDGVVRWISPAMEDNLSVSHLALLEPTDDPRPFCYLWVAYQEENSLTAPILRMYAMLFERKYSDKGTNLYFNLEGEPSLKFELELEEKCRIRNMYPIIRESNPEQTESGNRRGEDNLLLINVEGKSILFDLNQWYKEQMPRFIGECQNADAIFASYRTQLQASQGENSHISCAYLPSTLREFPCTTSTSPDEFFYPNSLSLEWAELGSKRITFWMTRGVQAQLLREMAMAGPIIMLQPTETFHRCIATGLVPFSTDTSFTNNADHHRDALLSLCLEQRWTTFLLKCAKEWSDGSAAYLFPAFIRWAIQRASTIRLTTHRLCIPLFDQSGSSIGEAEVKTLRFFSQQMDCLCNVVENLPMETNELEQQRRALRRISTHLQVLLWFYDVGLLPETEDIDEEALPISFILKIPYPAQRLASIYAEKREQYRRKSGKKEENEEDLFIDELITRECPLLRSQWEQESGERNYGGNYPPPSLQSLLRSCLTDCYYPDSNEMENKHQIIIYLLMDLVTLLQGSCPGVDQLIKYPSAFKLSPSLIKLTHALWFLDHEDYQGFLDTMTGQLVSESDIKDWHHRLVMRTLLRSSQNKMALVYLRVRKPPLSSIDDQGTAISLSVEHGLLQSAFHRRPASHYSQLLIKFFRACQAHGKLNDILHLALDNEEEEAFVNYLEGEKCEDTRLLYYLQRCRYNEASNVFPADQSIMNLHKGNRPTSLSMFHAYNATLPEITRRFSSNQVRRSIDVDSESRYPRPMSHYKSRVRPREILETVIRKARETFQRGERSQIPFVSAPCLTLKSNQATADSDCALFVERARPFYGKRSRDDMKEDDDMQNDLMETKKRRKTNDSDNIDVSGTRELGISVMLDTPLIKRNYQVNNSKDHPIETPHSILKIRQMICNSASPTGRVSPDEEEKMSEREKKPRQIRFSINQQKIDNSIDDIVPLVNEKSILEEDEPQEEEKLTKSRSATPKLEASETEDNQYFSPNASTVSLYEDTVLTDDSTNISMPLTGPRPRPGLKRSNLAISFDSSQKSSKESSDITESAVDFNNTSADVSFSSQIVSSTFMDVLTPRTNNYRPSLPSASIYADTILSSSSSVEVTPLNSLRTSDSRTSTGLETIPEQLCQNESPVKNYADQKHTSNSISPLSLSKTSHTKTVYEEVDVQDEESIHSEMDYDIKEVPVTIETQDVEEIEEKMEERQSSSQNSQFNEEVAIAQQEIVEEIFIDQQEIEEEYEVDEDTDEGNNSPVILDIDAEEDVEIIVEDDVESLKSANDMEDELMALKYEEDDDDVFTSLSNSLEQEYYHKRLSKSETQQELCENPTEAPIIEEYNITDDESSTSVDVKAATTKDLNTEQAVTSDEASKTLTAAISSSANVNITDDETDDSRGSLKPTESLIDKNPSEILVNHAATTSVKTSEETPKLSTSRSRRASSVQPVTDEPVLESREAQKISRSRRASSLVQEVLSPTRILRSTNSRSISIDQTPPLTKHGRTRRSTSLMKEVLTTALLNDHTPEDINETSIKRRTRRAASVQKEIPEVVKTPIKNIKSEESPMPIEESIDEPSAVPAPVKKYTRAKKATSVNKDVEFIPRRTRATSVSSDIDDSTLIITKPKRTRNVSVSKETIMEAPVEKPSPGRRTRAMSASKEIIDDVHLETSTSTRRKRGVSVTKEIKEEAPPRRTRATSVTKETPKEVAPRQRRAASVTKETTSVPRRTTRASSMSKDISDEDESLSKRITRRKASITKESSVEYLKTRKGSIMTEVIPEEIDDDESIFDVKSVRGIAEKDNDKLLTRTRSSSITVIPEEKEELIDVSKGKRTKTGKTRVKRAMSVDIAQADIKRRTRGLVRSKTTHDDSDEEEKSPMNETESKTTGKATRRKRAASETKEVGSQESLYKPKRGTKLTQRSQVIDDSYQFSAPDETRGAPQDPLGNL